MEIELYPILSTVILASTVMTIVFAIFSYILFRIREGRAAKRRLTTVAAEPAPAKAEATPKAAAAAVGGASGAPAQTGQAKPRFFRPYQPAL